MRTASCLGRPLASPCSFVLLVPVTVRLGAVDILFAKQPALFHVWSHRGDRVALRASGFDTEVCVPSKLPLLSGPQIVAATGRGKWKP